MTSPARTGMIRVAQLPQPLTEAERQALRRLHPATVGHEDYARPLTGLGALARGTRLLGPALTVRITPPDSAAVHAVVDLASPGDVVVIALGGSSPDGIGRAPVGGIIGALLAEAGVAGVVVDGPITDSAELEAVGLAVFSRGRSVVTTRMLGRSSAIGEPVRVAGVEIAPGDLLLGDDDGVLVVPRARLLADLDRLLDRQAAEGQYLERFRAGEPLARMTGAERFVRRASGPPTGQKDRP